MTSQPRIRVLVADDHAVVREGIRHVLSAAHGFDVVGEAASAAEAVRLAGECEPDVVLLDVSMPGGTGLEVIGDVRRAAPQARVLILSVHDEAEYVLQAVRAGAHGYLRKDSSPNDLRDAVRAVDRGDTYFSPAMAVRLSDAVRVESNRLSRASKLALLTGRERDVLTGIANGETNKEIAARYGISPRTVETHRESLMRKLEIRSVAGLTRLAVEEGLVPPRRVPTGRGAAGRPPRLAKRGHAEAAHADLLGFLQDDPEQGQRVRWRGTRQQRGVEHHALHLRDERRMLAAQLLLGPAEALALCAVPLCDQRLDRGTVHHEREARGSALVDDREQLADVAQVRRDMVLELGARDLTCARDLRISAQPVDDRRDDVRGGGDEQLA